MSNPALAASFGLDINYESFQAAVNSVNKLDKQVTKFLGGVEKIATAFAAGGVITGIYAFGKAAVNEFAKEEKATAQLAVALKNLGITNRAVAQDLADFAEQMEKSTTFEKEQIMDVEKLLSSFGLYGDRLKETTKAAADLSVGLGVDLHTAALMLGKAFDGNTASLSKLGIRIAEGTPRAEAFSRVMQSVQSKFGGQAAAEAGTYAGKLNILTKSFDDLKKQIGQELMPVANSWVATLQQMVNWWGKLLEKMTGADKNSLTPSQIYLKTAEEQLKNIRAIAERNKDFFTGKISPVLQAQISELEARIAAAKANVEKELKAQAGQGSIIPNRPVGAGGVVDLKEEQEKRRRAGMIELENENRLFERQLEGMARAEERSAMTIKGGWQLAMRDMQNYGMNWQQSINGALNSVEGNFASAFKQIVMQGGNMLTMLGDMVKALFDSILQAFLDLIAQMVAKAAIFELLNILTGGAFGVGRTLAGVMGFASGGYTGDGPSNTAAGIVHRGEFVLPASVTRSLGLNGMGVNSALNRLSMAGAGGVNISSPVSVTITGGIGSEVDISKIAEQIGEAVRKGNAAALRMSGIVAVAGSKRGGLTSL